MTTNALLVFWWNSTAKSVAWMVLDKDNLAYLHAPTIVDCRVVGQQRKQLDRVNLQTSLTAIKNEIQRLQAASILVQINHFTVSNQARQARTAAGKTQQVGSDSAHVKSEVEAIASHFNISESRVRFKLYDVKGKTKPYTLQFFIDGLNALGIPSAPEFMHRLWAIAMTATNKHKKIALIIFEMYRLMQAPGVTKARARVTFRVIAPQHEALL